MTKDAIRHVLGEKGWAWLERVVGPFVRSGDATDQWFRIVMNKETTKIIDALGPSELQVLEISGDYGTGLTVQDVHLTGVSGV